MSSYEQVLLLMRVMGFVGLFIGLLIGVPVGLSIARSREPVGGEELQESAESGSSRPVHQSLALPMRRPLLPEQSHPVSEFKTIEGLEVDEVGWTTPWSLMRHEGLCYLMPRTPVNHCAAGTSQLVVGRDEKGYYVMVPYYPYDCRCCIHDYDRLRPDSIPASVVLF